MTANYLRDYRGGTYSDLENFVPGVDCIGFMVREERKTDFYSAIDGVERHKTGSQTYHSPGREFTMRICEMRSDDGQPEFDISATENASEEKRRELFNLGFSCSVLNTASGLLFCYGVDDLNDKIKEAVSCIQWQYDNINPYAHIL